MDGEYPVVAYPLADRIAGAMTAYACGDALGLPWEQFPPAGASAAEIEALPAREGWERGTTSDDTALTLLVAQHLADRSGAADARAFLQTLAAQAGSIRAIGWVSCSSRWPPRPGSRPRTASASIQPRR
ncbi:MAG: ADP-ribosylglycohydrolase family protein [Pseudonocardiaceae bacterium]